MKPRSFPSGGGKPAPTNPTPLRCNFLTFVRGDRTMSERKGMLTLGNSHLGPLIHTFSLPAFSTCPGATLACLTVCYALQFLFYVKTNLGKHKANWERAESAP